jgi:hypothetical protein
MELALVLRRLLRHRLLLLTGVVVAAVVGILSTYRIHGFGFAPKTGVSHATASTQILVDTPSSAIANTMSPSSTLLSIAQTIANFAPNPQVLSLIGRHAGLQGSQIYAEGPVNLDLPRVVQEPTDLQRNVQIDHETIPYRIEFNQNPNIPVIGVDAQAPTLAGAERLANAAVAGLRDYISSLQTDGQVVAGHRVVLRQLGAATGSVDAPNAAKALAVLAFLGTFILWCVLVLAGGRMLEIWRRSAEVARSRFDGAHPQPAWAGADDAIVEEMADGESDHQTAAKSGRDRTPEARAARKARAAARAARGRSGARTSVAGTSAGSESR